jgi:hypothetical protein
MNIPIYDKAKAAREKSQESIDKADLAYIIRQMKDGPQYHNIPAFWIETLETIYERME